MDIRLTLDDLYILKEFSFQLLIQTYSCNTKKKLILNCGEVAMVCVLVKPKTSLFINTKNV